MKVFHLAVTNLGCKLACRNLRDSFHRVSFICNRSRPGIGLYRKLRIRDITCMTRMSDIPPELLAEMTPAVRAFVESLLVQMAEMQARMQAEIDELKAQVKKLTPKNSSVPPSTQHPHARPAAKPKPKSKKKHGGQNGHFRQSKRRAAMFLTDLLNMPCCPAALLPGIHGQHAESRCGSARATMRGSEKPTGKRISGIHGRNTDKAGE